MKTSRRNFLQFSSRAGTGLFLRLYGTFGVASEAGRFLERTGISTSIMYKDGSPLSAPRPLGPNSVTSRLIGYKTENEGAVEKVLCEP